MVGVPAPNQYLTWPAEPVEDVDLDGLPLVFVTVTTPHDQAALHRYLARLGYCPVLIGVESIEREEWRFHHPDGSHP